MKKMALVLSLAGIATAGTAAAARPADAWITTKIKLALLADGDVDGTRINVDTNRGNVTLHGMVPESSQETRAMEIARGIEGVRNVNDMISVGSDKGAMTGTKTTTDASTKGRQGGSSLAGADKDLNGISSDKSATARNTANDAQIRKDVEKAFKNDTTLANGGVTVASVDGGVVHLSGKTSSLNTQRRYMATARRVPGVVRVQSDIASNDDMNDTWMERKTKEGKVVSRAGDAWITSAVKLRLLADADTPGTAINVDTDDGVVTLFGMVETDAAKRQAETEATKVDDVRRVVNEIQVVSEQKQAAVEKKDDEITTSVKKAFDDDADLKDAGIRVDVKNGVVRLSGTVDSQAERLDAALLARSVPGVRSVQQDLKVKTTPVGT